MYLVPWTPLAILFLFYETNFEFAFQAKGLNPEPAFTALTPALTARKACRGYAYPLVSAALVPLCAPLRNLCSL